MSAALNAQHMGWGASTGPVVLDVATINGLGATPHQTWAFRRAETTAFVGSPFKLPSGRPVAFARVRQLDPRVVGGARLSALAERVLAAAQPALARVPREASTAALLCLPERMAVEHADAGERAIRAHLEQLVADRLGHRELATVARGHASFAYGLLEAAERMRRRELEVLIAVALDSYYDPAVLDRLFEAQRVLSSDWHDAFVPGEAATLMVLARADVARRLGATPLATIESAVSNEEVATLDNDVGLLGLGLSRAAVAVCKRMHEKQRRLAWWISDATGERFRIQELQLAWPRAAALAMTHEDRVELLPTHLGDIGAATMPTALAIGIEGLRRGDPRGQYCLSTGSSPGGSRGAVLIRAA